MPTSTTTSDEGSYTSIILLRCCAGDSVVVWCVGWAVWDSFKNITAEFSAGLAARIKTSAERLRDESEQRVLGWKLGKVNALKTSRDSTLNYYTSRFFSICIYKNLILCFCQCVQANQLWIPSSLTPLSYSPMFRFKITLTQQRERLKTAQ